MSRQWFAIRTQPRKEELAQTHYGRQGFVTYLPLILSVRRHARRIDQVQRPLFPGYIFLHLSMEERNWTTIGSTIGAIGPVRFGEYYPQVPDWVIEGMRAHEDEKGLIRRRNAQFKPGDRVTVIWNYVEELEGIFQATRGEERALILLEILRRQVPTVVPIMALTKVQGRSGGLSLR